MQELMAVLDYLGKHPDHGILLVVALLGVYYLLNRQSKMARDAERRLAELREERGNYYRDVRPPQ